MPSIRWSVDGRTWRVAQCLKDGQWHSLSQLGSLLSDVPPQLAYREYAHRRTNPLPFGDAAIAKGREEKVLSILDDLKRDREYVIEVRGRTGSKEYRLLCSPDDGAQRADLALPCSLEELSPPAFALLKADIEHRGIIYPIVVDEDGGIIDGHHRKRVWDELVADGRKEGPCPQTVLCGLTPEQKEELAIVLNVYRRHLAPEARQRLVAWLRMRGWSYRKIAKAAGVSHPTVMADARRTGKNLPFPQEELPPSEPAPGPESPSTPVVATPPPEAPSVATAPGPEKPQRETPRQPRPRCPKTGGKAHGEAQPQEPSGGTASGMRTVTCPSCGLAFLS